MWQTVQGDRVLKGAEWRLFVAGLKALWDRVERCSVEKSGVKAFDGLSSDQKMVLLAEVAVALRDPTIKAPHLNVVRLGAIMAVFDAICHMLAKELTRSNDGQTTVRQLVLAAAINYIHRDLTIPDLCCTNQRPWSILIDFIIDDSCRIRFNRWSILQRQRRRA